MLIPPPQDQDVRDRVTRSTAASMLVEAAAGTGKTTLIVSRILQGVRDGSLRLATTVAITYTEKAAGELEGRIRQALAAALREEGVPPDQLARLQAAAAELDRANISTIHAFCARLLREKPVEAGVDPEFEVLEPAASQVLYDECWQRWMEGQVAAPPQALSGALRAGVSVGRLKDMARVLADAPEILEGGAFHLPLPAEECDVLMRRFTAEAPQVDAILRSHMQRDGNEDSRGLLSISGAAAAADPASQQARRLAYRAAAFDAEKAAKSIKKSEKDAALLAFGSFVGAAQDVGAHLAGQVFAWAAGFVRAYQQAKLDRSALDFQDLLLFAARMLRNDLDLRRYFQRRFDAFFVDEFQDTDPLQAELIAYLCEDPAAAPASRMEEVRLAEGKLVAVGDPKQSIYRFRRADVQVYDRFKTLFGPGRVELIQCNFRSAERLIDWLNAFFERVFGRRPSPGVYQAQHVPLAAPPGAPAEQGPHVLSVCPPAALDCSELGAGAGRRLEALFLARTVRELVDGTLSLPGRAGGWRWADFAFLFRALTDVGAYEEALDEHGVPFVVVGGKHFYSREQTVETVALLRAVDDPLDEQALVAALRGSYFGLSDEELLAYRQGGGAWNYLRPENAAGPVAEALARMAVWHGARATMAPHLLLERILRETRARESFMLKPAGAQRAANLDKLVGLLRAYGATARTFGAVVRHLSELQEEEMPEEESSAMEPGDDFVRIMSMHKAKGLEFPAVVLPDLLREFPGAGRVAPLLFSRLDGAVALRVAKGVESANYAALQEAELGNQTAELSRLLYVACTRAERLLVLPLGWWKGRRAASFEALVRETGLAEAGADVFQVDTASFLPGMEIGRRPARTTAGAPAEADGLLRQREAWAQEHGRLAARASAAERFVLPSELESAPRSGPPARESAGRPGGKDFGSLFHNLMSVVPLEAAQASPRLLLGLARIEAAALGADGQATSEAARLAEESLANAEFRALLSGGEAQREVSFCVPLKEIGAAGGPEGYAEGSMDLLVRAGGGCVVLDYKTDSFASGEQGRTAERYWPQLGLYGLAAQACGLARGQVELALFFVRAGVIVRRPLDEALAGRVRELAGGPGPGRDLTSGAGRA
jgi:ATP-dependent helicase/nuclease subunit A